jgi:hypothetical protein
VDRKEKYLGIYGALRAAYAFTDTFTVDVQVANQLGLFTLTWENDPLKSTTNILGAYAGVTYTVIETENVTFSVRGGVNLKLNSFTYQNYKASDSTVVKHKAGYLDFGIPIGLRVTY